MSADVTSLQVLAIIGDVDIVEGDDGSEEDAQSSNSR